MTARQRRFVFTDPDVLGKARRRRNLSIGQVAIAIGVCRPTVLRWEQGQFGGERGIPADKADALLRVLRLEKRPDLLGRFTGPEPEPGALSRVDAVLRGALSERAHERRGWSMAPLTADEQAELGLLLYAVADRLVGKRGRRWGTPKSSS